MRMKKLLNIPKGYKITKIEVDDDEINVWIEPYKRKIALCSHCGEVHKEGYHGTKEIKVRDLPMVGRKVHLYVTKRRYKCPVDGCIYIEHIDWLKKKGDIPPGILLRYTV